MKIALIAMSGIRVQDAELLNLGLTLPGFVERSKAIASLPSLGLLTLAGMTPPEHVVEYIEVADLQDAEGLA
ncbi:MAG: B12-binding domain-containing radical SAM protein, partial [Planctomycetota bacterium]